MFLAPTYCPGGPCDPCALLLLGILGTFQVSLDQAKGVRFHMIASSPPDQVGNIWNPHVSATIRLIGGTPDVTATGTLQQDAPFSITYIAVAPLSFTAIDVPSDFDFSHIKMTLASLTVPNSPDPGHRPAIFDWGTVGLSFDGGLTYSGNYTVV